MKNASEVYVESYVIVMRLVTRAISVKTGFVNKAVGMITHAMKIKLV